MDFRSTHFFLFLFRHQMSRKPRTEKSAKISLLSSSTTMHHGLLTWLDLLHCIALLLTYSILSYKINAARRLCNHRSKGKIEIGVAWNFCNCMVFHGLCHSVTNAKNSEFFYLSCKWSKYAKSNEVSAVNSRRSYVRKRIWLLEKSSAEENSHQHICSSGGWNSIERGFSHGILCFPICK